MRPGLKVADVFTIRGHVCPFIEGGPFASAEEMLAAFDKPDELFIVDYGHNVRAIAHTRDRELIARKQKLVDTFIAKIGKPYGELSVEEVLWVYQQVNKALLESN